VHPGFVLKPAKGQIQEMTGSEIAEPDHYRFYGARLAMARHDSSALASGLSFRAAYDCPGVALMM
jgi:hypothetical protein